MKAAIDTETSAFIGLILTRTTTQLLIVADIILTDFMFTLKTKRFPKEAHTIYSLI